MKFQLVHNNLNVSNLETSLDFYKEALGLSVLREKNAADGSFKLRFLSDGISDWELELTWLRDHPQKYDLGENEIHLALRVDDFDAALAKHKEMDCVCYENEAMGIYFIEDPDGYWIEIVPTK